MTTIPIVFAFSNEFVLPGWVSIRSLIKSANSNTTYIIHILHEDLDDQNILKFKNMGSNRHPIRFLDASKVYEKVDLSNVSTRWPKILFARLFITEIIKDYHKIIVSDVDVLFKKDLSSFYDKDISNYHYGLVAAEKRIQNIKGHDRYGFYKNKFIFYSGLVIYNKKKMDKDKICNRFINSINQLKNRLGYDLTDLILLNKCSRRIYRIPFNYCVLESIILKGNIKSIPEYGWLSQLYKDSELKNFKKNPSIIHYTCHGEHREKPWDRLSPPKDYLSFIKESPYKYSWLADNTLKRLILKNKNLAIISNTKFYKNGGNKLLKFLLIFYFRYLFFKRKV